MLHINCRNLLGHTTGVQRYTQKIIEYLNPNEITKIYPDTNYASGAKGHIWEQFILPKKLGKNDMLWSPCNTGPLSHHNQILTIHDTVSFDHPEWLNSKFVWWYKFLQPKLANKIQHIITISEFSKSKIIEHCNIPEEKISVVYNGIDLTQTNLTDEINPRFVDLPPYILSVGSLEPRKNLSRLISAFNKYKNETNDNIKLIIVGKAGVSRVFGDAGVDGVNCEDIIFTGHVTDNELFHLYNHAKGFCYPSLYEGFGLPPLEAMQFSIPVLTSNTTAINELCQNRAILVDPLSVDDIAEGIYRLLNNEISEQVIESNLDYVKSLTWQTCAKKTYNIISQYQ